MESQPLISNKFGSYHCWHRTYDPYLRHFTGPDPAQAPFWHLHGYTGNSPFDGSDPTGLFWQPPWWVRKLMRFSDQVEDGANSGGKAFTQAAINVASMGVGAAECIGLIDSETETSAKADLATISGTLEDQKHRILVEHADKHGYDSALIMSGISGGTSAALEIVATAPVGGAAGKVLTKGGSALLSTGAGRALTGAVSNMAGRATTALSRAAPRLNPLNYRVVERGNSAIRYMGSTGGNLRVNYVGPKSVQAGEDLFVGSYNASRRGNIRSGLNTTHTPHHSVQHAASTTTRGRGVTINLRKDIHQMTRTFSRPFDQSLTLRQHLAADVWDLRRLLGSAGYESGLIRQQLKELIRKNKRLW